ncbi:hypothetical protein [Paraliomyxa miuraensis]|uniref:hypothetical protein n=1 Tax=Paraliomyxa miuraensis TaxID=376150 RepID=UPI00224F0881|nr:hypothetical protein [Paraliomyxa miuraensis]MCX4245822.1 hypothetical protein [Paraliomyxa miuraensis]
MASDPQGVLDSIPTLLSQRDAQALVDLRDHADKKVRKAVRKALHTLESRGVAIPEGPSRSWSAGNVQAELRGSLESLATVDTRSLAGALRFMLSLPQEHSGARLYVGALSPEDRVLEFGAYQQTDGQRGRLERDWQRQHEGRQVPVDWLRARIVWARGNTLAKGFSVPRALDEALPRLGDAPSQRPTAQFLGESLAGEPAFEGGKIDELLTGASVQLWPPLVDLEPVLQRAAEIHGDKPQPTDDDARTELMRQALEGQDGIREGLRTTLANALEDTAVGLWVEGKGALARLAHDAANELRSNEAPETLPWVPRLLGFQVASLLRVVQQQGGMGGS